MHDPILTERIFVIIQLLYNVSDAIDALRSFPDKIVVL